MPVCRPQKRGTEPQLSGRRLKLMDGWGWNRIGIAMAGKSTGLKKDSEQESATETGEACTHTTLIKSGEILRLKLWSGSCVSVEPKHASTRSWCPIIVVCVCQSFPPQRRVCLSRAPNMTTGRTGCSDAQAAGACSAAARDGWRQRGSRSWTLCRRYTGEKQVFRCRFGQR